MVQRNKWHVGFISFLLACLTSLTAQAQEARPAASAVSNGSANAAANASPDDQGTIPPGTTITTQNWRQYQGFMSVGLRDLFEGKYFWKMPPDVEIEVGPTTVNPPPKTYIAATEKYAGDVRVVQLPDGGLNLSGYQGGAPFPNPSEPHKGWKIMADVWYRYVPHLYVINHAAGCSIDRRGNINCAAGDLVFRQLSFNTDPGVPVNVPGAQGKFYTQWYMITEPENLRYTASLTIGYTDLRRFESLYAFIPSLRRSQPVSNLARCSMTQGIDITQEDYRGGFDSNITQINAEYLGEKKVLALLMSEMPGRFPDAFQMPLGFAKPSWGKWQVRDVHVVSIKKLPSLAAGYCYGKRVLYIDKTTFNPYWEEIYDSNMRLWKIGGLFLHTVNVPRLGPVDSSGSLIYSFWDIQNDHASFIMDPTENKYPIYINDQTPNEYRDLARYSTPGGLDMIMR